MVRIRLRRVGLKKQPSYRIVVADKRRARDGKFIETIGFYNPRTQPDTIKVKEDRALYWLNVGAQPSDSVRSIFNRIGTLDRLGRLKSGEEMDVLVAEAVATAEAEESISPKTRFLAPIDAAAAKAAVVEAVETEAEESEEADAEETEAEAEESEAEAEESEEVDAEETEAEESEEADAEETEAEESEEADAEETETEAVESDVEESEENAE